MMNEADSSLSGDVFKEGFDSSGEGVRRGKMNSRVQNVEDVVGCEFEGFDEVVDLGVGSERDVAWFRRKGKKVRT